MKRVLLRLDAAHVISVPDETDLRDKKLLERFLREQCLRNDVSLVESLACSPILDVEDY